MSKQLTPIERMIDAACGFDPSMHKSRRRREQVMGDGLKRAFKAARMTRRKPQPIRLDPLLAALPDSKLARAKRAEAAVARCRALENTKSPTNVVTARAKAGEGKG